MRTKSLKNSEFWFAPWKIFKFIFQYRKHLMRPIAVVAEIISSIFSFIQLPYSGWHRLVILYSFS